MLPSKLNASFITKFANYTSSPGDYIDIDGNVLGKHKGHIHYTVGQRKGLGIALGAPAYVLSKDTENNTVTLGRNEQLFSRTVYAKSLNLSEIAAFPGRYDVKIRYAHRASPASVTLIGDDRIRIEFDEPQRAAAPGQSAVLYLGDTLVGGGFIE